MDDATLNGFFDEFEKIALTFQELEKRFAIPHLSTVVKSQAPNVKLVNPVANLARRRLGTMATQAVAPIVQRAAA